MNFKNVFVSFITVFAFSMPLFAAAEFESVDTITQCSDNNMMYFFNVAKNIKQDAGKNIDGKMTESDFNRFLERMELDNVKRDKIKAIRKSAKDSKKKIQDEIIVKYKALNKELSKKLRKKKVIKKLKKQIRNLAAQSADITIDERSKVRNTVNGTMYKKIYKERTKFDRLGDELMLSDEQQTKLEELFSINGKHLDDLKQQLEEKKKLLEHELMSSANDRELIDSLTNDITELSKSILKTMVNTRVYLKTILTSDQYDKFNNTSISSETKASN